MVKCTKRQIRQLKPALHWKMPEAQRQRIQMILLRESGMTQPAIAEALKAASEQAIGHPTSNSTIYNLLNRNGWRKLMPRPFHPKRDCSPPRLNGDKTAAVP